MINLRANYPEDRFSRKAFVFISAVFVLSLILKLYHIYSFRSWMMLPDGWIVTEFLINFEGGFVRRGMLGQMLYRLAESGVPTMTVIYSLSIFAYALAFVIYARLFRKKGISWWLLLTPWMFAEVYYLAGRDFLLFSAVAAMMALAASHKKKVLCRIAMVCLTVVCMMIHEAFVFWGVPLAALLLMRERSSRTFGWFFAIFSVACFVVLASFKGDMAVAQAITDSWRPFFTTLPEHPKAAVQAIGWETIDAAKFHLYENYIGRIQSAPVAPLFVRPMVYALWFFIMVNCLAQGKSRGTVAALIVVITVCLLPMYTIFCCDFTRIYQFATFAVVATWCVVPRSRIVAAMPAWLTCTGERLVGCIDSVLKPTPLLIVILMLFVAENHSLFNLSDMLANSVVGEICATITNVLHKLIIMPTAIAV